jgi:hypothetical protein
VALSGLTTVSLSPWKTIGRNAARDGRHAFDPAYRCKTRRQICASPRCEARMHADGSVDVGEEFPEQRGQCTASGQAAT